MATRVPSHFARAWYVAFAMRMLSMGRCDVVDGEGVVTRFSIRGPIFVPHETVYTAGRSRRSFAVKRHAKSVALAYLRWLVAPLAIALLLVAAPELKLLVVFVVAAWVALVFVTALTFGTEARQRRLLATCVGHAAPPELLRRGMQELVMADLERIWELHGKVILSWRYLSPDNVSVHALPMYYTLCRYEAALTGDAIMRDRATLAWRRLAPAREGVLCGLPHRRFEW